MMDSSRIYKYRFDELLKIFKKNGSHLIENFGKSEDSMLIDICGNDFREYQSVISDNESWVIYTVVQITKDLLSEYGIQYNVPEYEKTSLPGRLRKVYPFSFVLVENDKKIAYVFLYKICKGLMEIREDCRKKYKGVDGVKFYFIQKNNTPNLEILNEIETKEDYSFLSFARLQDFFDEKFGCDEFAIFNKYANEFNDKARKIMGFKMIVMPTAATLDQFKKKKLEMLSSDETVSKVKDIVGSGTYDIIKRNYVDRNHYKLMLASGDYANSFLSSEWYYGIHSITGEMDQTGLVTGYLKSVEQLLYEIIKLSWIRGKKRKISIINGKSKQFEGTIYSGDLIDFNEANESFADKTLGSLIRFIKYKNHDGEFFNQDLFNVDHDTVKILIDTLYCFKNTKRNDHLHKDNIYTVEEVEDIRNTAIMLYALILGAFDIRENELELLGMKTKSINEEISKETLYDMISDWAYSVIKYDMPKKTNVVAFKLSHFQGKPWNLCLQGLSKIPKDKYDQIEWNHKMLYSSLMTQNSLEWQSTLSWEDGAEQIARIIEKFIKDDDRGIELSEYPEIVLGDLNVIKVFKTNNK